MLLVTRGMMPKTGAERNKKNRARNVLFAREKGMCITCFTKRPEDGRSICSPCIQSAYERTVRRRALLRRRKEWEQIVAAHEAAGDKAQAHHLFDHAALHYQEALNVAAI